MPVTEDGAAGDAALLTLIRPLAEAPGDLAVAVSGGSDSMAALHLLARAFGPRLHAVTVDHGLRAEAADEARFVGQVCAGLGVSHRVLVWQHGVLAGNLQDKARQARYGLIGGWARGAGLSRVVVAHTADDQAETLLMGLARGAGIDGLAGMRPCWQAEGLTWLRPFLTTPREALRAYLRRHGQGWRDDPSNEDDRFTRVRARRALKALAPLGITGARLAAVAGHLAQARQALDRVADEALAFCTDEAAGALTLHPGRFATLPPEIARRLVLGALRWIAGTPHPPRHADLDRLIAAIGAGRDATLAGCRLIGRTATLCREERAVAAHTTPTHAVWDGRWSLCGPHDPALHLGALGAEGLRLCPGWRATGLHRAVLAATPAVWDGPRLVAAPLAGLSAGWQAICPPVGTAFNKVH